MLSPEYPLLIPESLRSGPPAIAYRAPVTGPHVIPFLPSYIPTDVDMDQVKVDVGDDGISVPAVDAADVPALRQVVADARKDGLDLKIVVIARNPPVDTPLRDIATEVGEAYPGSTVLMLSPSYAGTYSPTFDRVALEAGQDLARTGDPVQSSKNFVSQLTTPDFPWTALTIVLVLGVAGCRRVLQVAHAAGSCQARSGPSNPLTHSAKQHHHSVTLHSITAHVICDYSFFGAKCDVRCKG